MPINSGVPLELIFGRWADSVVLLGAPPASSTIMHAQVSPLQAELQ